MSPLRSAELQTLAAIVLLSAAALGVAGGDFLPLGLTAVILVIQGLRGFQRPMLPRSAALPFSLLLALRGLAQYLALELDGILVLAHFLLGIQWMRIVTPHDRRDEESMIGIALMLMAVAAVSAVEGLFGLLLIVFAVTLVHALALRRIAGAFETWVRPDAQGLEAFPSLHGRLLRANVAVTFLALGSATGLFFLFPRLSNHALRMPRRVKNKMTGFSERVAFNSIGRIKRNRARVMRVEVESGRMPPAPYFRGAVFDTYSDGEWQQVPRELVGQVASDSRGSSFSFERIQSRGAPATLLSFYLEPLDVRPLFSAGPTSQLSFRNTAPRSLRFDLHAGIATPIRHRRSIVYRTRSWPGGAYPLWPGRFGRYALARCRAIPPELDGDRLAGIALAMLQSQGARAAPPLTKIRAIEDFLSTRYEYSLDLADPGGEDPVMYFLETSRRGHCEFFASALVLLLRSINIPARLVNGFRSTEFHPYTKSFTVRQSDAHAWVEAFVSGRGWLRFDPTPAASAVSGSSESGEERLGWLRDWLELSWSKYVVAFDQHEQETLVSSITESIRGFVRGEPEVSQSKTEGSATPEVTGGKAGAAPIRGIALLLLAVILVSAWWQVRRRAGQSPEQRALGPLLRALARHKIWRAGHETITELCARALKELELSDAQALAAIPLEYERWRYRPESPEQAPEELRRLIALAGVALRSAKRGPRS